MTHIELNEDLLPLLHRLAPLFSGMGFVEHYDFALANTSYESRVQAVTKVASICYGNPKALGSINLFNRLQAEAAGLPSSSYEFIPILLDMSNTYVDYSTKHPCIRNVSYKLSTCIKYGEYIAGTSYLLTNLRALIADVGVDDSLNYLNTSPEEIQIIKDNFKVYLFNIDLATRAQMVRHRCSWQELSRRYVSGKKTPFEFYVSAKLGSITTNYGCTESGTIDSFNMYDIISLCADFYDTALASGVKPEEARRILPQAMMTTIWGAFQPTQLANFFTLRLDSHAQREIRLVAEAMKEAIDGA